MLITEYTSYHEDEIFALYSSVGWTAYTSDMGTLKQGFKKSLLVLAAYEGGKLLGIIRVVGDGCTIVYIQDVLVYPEHQRRGVGSALLQAVLDHFQEVRQIVLSTDQSDDTVAFYESMGFQKLEKLGCCGFMKLR